MQLKEETKSTSRIAHLTEKFLKVRQQSLALCKPLKPEDYVVQPVVDVSPPKWHLAHTTWFFEALVLAKYNSGYKVFDDDYGYMFNSYYETVGERVLRPNRGFMTRPTIEDVMAYRTYVDEQMQGFFLSVDDDQKRILDVIEIGINHEQQHQELLVTDFKYILGHNPLFPVYKNDLASSPSPENAVGQFLKVDEGLYEIGHRSNEFCYDNELGVHKVFLHPYEIMDKLVTNGQYREFIEDGGYTNFKWWYSEGWDWVKNNDIQGPMYWHKSEDTWHNYTLSGFDKIDPHSPVTHINQFEADAFARWKGLRLPTEFEWEIACGQYAPKVHEDANFVEEGAFGPKAAAMNNNQFYGDCWEWTNSAYLPYPYF